MKTDLETIENYLTGQLPSDERAQFEVLLRTDPAAADAVAFYVLTKQAAREDAREQRRAELDTLRMQTVPVRSGETRSGETRPLWSAPMRWAAAASIIVLLGLGWVFFRPTDSAVMASRLTDEYIAAHFMELSKNMEGGTVDSLKIGVGLFNENKLTEADAVFQNVLAHEPANVSALKYAGIVSLRQENYDKAITLFHQLSLQTDLVSNPGTFYEALAHLKRGQPLDKSQVKKLLEDVITKNLGGKPEAEKLLDQL